MERKTMKVPVNIHRELKVQSAKAGMSMVDYLSYLLKKEVDDGNTWTYRNN